jgi:hypothetical protein
MKLTGGNQIYVAPHNRKAGRRNEQYAHEKTLLYRAAWFLFAHAARLDGVDARGFSLKLGTTLIQICVNVGWTVFFTAISYFVMIHPLRERPPSDAEEHDTNKRI